MELSLRKKTSLGILLLILFFWCRSANAEEPISDSLSEALFTQERYRELINASCYALHNGEANDLLFFRLGVAYSELKNDARAILMFEKIQSQSMRNIAAAAYLRACKNMYHPPASDYLQAWKNEKKTSPTANILFGATTWLAPLPNPDIRSFTSANDGFAASIIPKNLQSYALFADVLFRQQYKCVIGYTNNRLQVFGNVWNNFDNITRAYTWQQDDFYALFSSRFTKHVSAGVFFHQMQSTTEYLNALWNPSSVAYSYTNESKNSSAAIAGAHFHFKNTLLECEANPSFLQLENAKIFNLEVAAIAYPLGNQSLITYLRLYATSDSIKNRNLFYAGIGSMPVKNFWIKGGFLWGSVQNQVSMAGSVFTPIPDNSRYLAEAEAVCLSGRFTFSLKYNHMLRYTDIYKVNMPDVFNPSTYKSTVATHTYRIQTITFSIKYRL